MPIVPKLSRRVAVKSLAAASAGLLWGMRPVAAAKRDSKWDEAITKGLNWVAKTQNSAGYWTASGYTAAMTALAGTALIASGSTTTQGPYSKAIRKAVDYLVDVKFNRNTGLLGDSQDNRYTYGHGFSMLFLSQVLGEEEDEERRLQLIEVLSKSVEFSGRAQTPSGGWGYISAKDGNNFDEGSTTITQVQGLRGCRNGGIVVPGDIIDKAKEYIYSCMNPDGGISYSSRNRGSSRPAITAAALATLYNAGDYEGKQVPQMLEYCKKNLQGLSEGPNSFGHWHYTYLYYSQVMYRQGGKEWEPFRDKLCNRIVGELGGKDNWDGNVGAIYVTACNLIMLQLDKAYLPIFQR